jgi:hypothetical protein
MKSLLILAFILFIYETTFSVEPRWVNFDAEMTNAEFIDRVVIESYDTNGMS